MHLSPSPLGKSSLCWIAVVAALAVLAPRVAQAEALLVVEADTGKVLQAVVYRGGSRLWIAGKGGTMLKRIEPLSPRTMEAFRGAPELKTAPRRIKPKPRLPLVTITDDGDIPIAVPPKKP